MSAFDAPDGGAILPVPSGEVPMPARSDTSELTLRPAPLAARCAAFLLDCVAGFGCALLCGAAAWLLLLLTSNNGATRPADAAIYVALALATACLPIWAGFTLIAWVRTGSSPGQAAMALRVAGRDGSTPGTLRALVRVLLLGLAAVLALLAVLLLIATLAAASLGVLPLPLGLVAVVPIALGVADPLSCLLSRERRALHDRAAGTLVVCAA